ncbi:hypothetical protein L1994_10595 [Methanomicrobium antiquum]|uniref:DUF2178 domain-containing protein n=1 Tax=Methanomicrobium antiquum TaxID=487686 RepID=A0AAF0FL80_9EURY|nr:hypothetical protein [Methanomicrobium antiquum]MDD3977792.1 hypothetical protein [Methanomicrobium sp.]WFN36573.1 hypothetical protein L1994_10595 [Methanomicrobium antiquum]
MEKMEKSQNNIKNENNIKTGMPKRDRRFIVTASFGIAAVIIVLLAMFLSGNEPDSEALGLGIVIILLLTALTVVKTTKKRTVLYGGLVLGIIMFVMGIILSVAVELPENAYGFSAMTISGIIMIIICTATLKRPKDYDVRDERSLKIGTWAIAYSWYLSFLAVIVMFWLSYFSVVELTITAVLGILMFLMPLSAVVFQWYFSKKGDVY